MRAMGHARRDCPTAAASPKGSPKVKRREKGPTKGGGKDGKTGGKISVHATLASSRRTWRPTSKPWSPNGVNHDAGEGKQGGIPPQGPEAQTALVGGVWGFGVDASSPAGAESSTPTATLTTSSTSKPTAQPHASAGRGKVKLVTPTVTRGAYVLDCFMKRRDAPGAIRSLLEQCRAALKSHGMLIFLDKYSAHHAIGRGRSEQLVVGSGRSMTLHT